MGALLSALEKYPPPEIIHFKQEAGDLSRFETLGELIEEIYQMMYYYNDQRIHSRLKMPPAEFKKQFIQTKIKSVS